LNTKGEQIINTDIVNKIKKQLENPDTQYGYIKMTCFLKTEGFINNKKKVYRQNGFTLLNIISITKKRNQTCM